MIGAALGLTGGSIGGGPDRFVSTPTDASLDAALEERSEQAASRGLARASLAPGAATAPLPRAQAPSARPAPQAPAPASQGAPAAPLPDVPEDCEEYSGNRQIGCTLLSEFGYGIDQMPSLDALWTHESGWNHEAYNSSTGAYGIPQALPGSKMSTAGDDWETNPATQIRWGLGYIQDRYGDPDGAWSFFQANGWY